MRKLMLPALLVGTLLATSAPTAIAASRHAHAAYSRSETKKERKQNHKIKKNSRRVSAAVRKITANTSAVGDVASRVTNLEAALKALTDSVTAAVTTATTALTQINAALNDTTTGLVGLNAVRPQYGAFRIDGTIIGGTGQVTGASGPKTDATKGGAGPPDIDGLFVVDFGNNVADRVYSVNVYPYVPVIIGGGGLTPTGSAVNCSAAVAAVCGAVGAGPRTPVRTMCWCRSATARPAGRPTGSASRPSTADLHHGEGARGGLRAALRRSVGTVAERAG